MGSQIWALVIVIRVSRNLARLPRLSLMSQCLVMAPGGHQGKNHLILTALVHEQPVRVDMQLFVYRPVCFQSAISIFSFKQC